MKDLQVSASSIRYTSRNLYFSVIAAVYEMNDIWPNVEQ